MQSDFLEQLNRNPADGKAWAELYALLRPWVFTVCYRWVGRFADAEDATQQTFMHLASHWHKLRFDDLLELNAYLKRTAISRSVDLLRIRNRTQSTALPRESAEPVAAEAQPQPPRSADELRDLAGVSREQWRQFSDRQKQVLWLSYQGYPHQEIAKRLEVSPRTVRRDLSELRQLLQGFRGENA